MTEADRGPRWAGGPLELLRLSARVRPEAADDDRLVAAAARLDDWSAIPALADAHGLAPLLYTHLKRLGVAVPADAQHELAARFLAHQHANRVRFRVLGEILDVFEKADIPVVVLKGAALAHILYPAIGLRPLSDLDLLVHRGDALRAQSLLLALGFWAPPSPLNRELAGHHHLPGAIRTSDGQTVLVEIHLDAFSRDSPGSLTMDRLSGPPQPFRVEGRPAQALGHADMLFHLCRHAAECAPLLRLIWVADVVGYATRYRHDIDWKDLRESYPFVLNALSLLHLVTELPAELLDHVTPANAGDLRGVGAAGKPLTEIFAGNRSYAAMARDVFDPSDWWLRLYYALNDRAPLGWYRRVRHPLHVGGWLVRRAGSYVKWRIGR